mgnify:FL=1
MLNKSTPNCDKVLDTKNALCPVPVLLTRESMIKMTTGQILKVITRDPIAKSDISIWAERTGNNVLKIEELNGKIILYIQKRDSKNVLEDNEYLQMSTKKVEHRRLYSGEIEAQTITSYAPLEAPAHITVNNKSAVTLMATPTHLEDLAVGYLLDENVVDNIKQIVNIEVNGTEISVKTKNDVTDRIKDSETNQLVTSECVSLDHYLRLSERINLPKSKSDYNINASELRKMIKEFNSRKKEKTHPGGIHSASLFEKGEMKHYLMDVSRHSAVDKVFGASAKDGVDFTQSIIITSGRQPAGMVLKAAQMNIPISVSMRGPIYSGIIAAHKTGITLVCYASANRLDIYSKYNRIISL